MEMEKKVIGGHGPAAAKEGAVNEGEDADAEVEKK